MNKLLISICLLISSYSSSTYALLIAGDASIDENNLLTINYSFTATDTVVESFDLFFEYGIYDDIQILDSIIAPSWTTVIANPDNFFGFIEDGFINFLFDIPLEIGQTLQGPTVTIDYLGTGALAEITQSAVIFDPNDFSAPEIFVDTAPITVSQVNTPVTFSIVLLGAFFLFSKRTRLCANSN